MTRSVLIDGAVGTFNTPSSLPTPVSSIDPNEVEYIPAEAASTYAKLADAYGRKYYDDVADVVSAHLAPERRLLDVGTGPGLLPIAIATRTDGVRIDGLDATVELLAYGRRRARERGVGARVSFLAADCYAIPIADRRYDALTCTGVLHSLDAPARALTEFHRVLRPGGEAWVFDPAVLDVPDQPDVEFTDHERAVFETYGVRAAADEPPISVAEAKRIVARTPFDLLDVSTGPHEDVRLHLARE